LLACEHDSVRPDGLILGKALGGGLFPISMFLARDEVMRVFSPGDHGSTFGGNPLAAAVAREALNVLTEERLSERSAELGSYFLNKLRTLDSPLIKELRGKGLFIGMEISERYATAREVCEQLLRQGILSKETHDTVVRFAPPLTITKEELDWTFARIRNVLTTLDALHSAA
jgi:ornithine--oxo-acid transaminase